MIIYKITNLINNKIYIGQTTQELKQRIQNYKEEIKFSNTNRPPDKKTKIRSQKVINSILPQYKNFI